MFLKVKLFSAKMIKMDNELALKNIKLPYEWLTYCFIYYISSLYHLYIINIMFNNFFFLSLAMIIEQQRLLILLLY